MLSYSTEKKNTRIIQTIERMKAKKKKQKKNKFSKGL